ncbi:class I SAM-dependent methyltransferase [Nocardiopsis sp. NPDC006832]|uniref:SAM-dependent methyltransferase n=1 Tax=Nocardiopsis sp. NPDC006832 TaxID=3157188 RepID=UPI0033C15731
MESETAPLPSNREFWEGRYHDEDSSSPDPGPSPAFTSLIEDPALAPPSMGTRRALELACGRGGDALWTAARGWHVTAVDISERVLAVLNERARRAGLADRLSTRHHDLALSVPEPEAWDLVYANHFHTPTDIDRDAILRRVSDSVVEGGLLIVIDHGSSAPWSWEQREDHPTPEDLWNSLDLGADWSALVCERRSRLAQSPEGAVGAGGAENVQGPEGDEDRTAWVIDNVLVARRRSTT